MKSASASITVATVLVVLFTVLSSLTVEAHVTANPSSAVSGAYFQSNFRVPHGCDGNATDMVIVEIPKGVTSVKPRAVLPWNTTINMVALDVPIVTPSGTVNTTIGSVVWSNSVLLDSMYEDFGLQFKLPVMEGPLYWHVYQRCVNNAWNNWTGVPDASGNTAGFPAAVITVLNATGSTTTPNGGNGANPSSKPNSAGGSVFQSLGLQYTIAIGASVMLLALI
ncbi:hypothetical protein BGZ98_004975 [Dissophora globulifera]|nr:hypothetical protein BGZ98_004975 [Dissophora globulifera]